MKRVSLYMSIICVGSIMVFSGCATKVTRMEPEKIVDISGRWNDTDSRLVAEEIGRAHV